MKYENTYVVFDVTKGPKVIIETLDTLIALKKVIQWRDIKKPAMNIWKKISFFTLKLILNIKAIITSTRKAIDILYHTSEIESIEISEPLSNDIYSRSIDDITLELEKIIS